jgi:predicted RND superfamily exporter protein
VASFDKTVAKGIAGVSLWSSRHAKVVVALVLLATVTFGYGVTKITTNVDVADVLPRGNHNTDAAYNLTEHFRSTFTQQTTFQLHVDDGDRWAIDQARNLPYRFVASLGDQASADAPQGPWQVQANSQNITDEVYVRAMEELALFVEDHTNNEYSRQVSINNIYALVNWTVAGGYGVADDDAFALPTANDAQGALRYQVVDQVTKAALMSTVDALASPSWNHGAMLFMPPADSTTDMRVLGERIIAARDAYVEEVDFCIANPESQECDLKYTVWGSDNRPLLTVDLPVANAHSSQLVEQDMLRLMPLVALFILISLFIAFRNIRSIVISFTALGVGVVWTYGTMGFMGIALNTLNMTIVPLIMGVGIDYAIHMINEFLEHKAEGRSDEEAFRIAGGRAGLAMLIATLTTVFGLAVMVMSPSLLMAQMGFLSAVAIGSIYVLTISFIPAALTLIGGTDKMGASFTPSTSMPAIARFVTKTRILMLFIVIVLTVGAFYSAQSLEEEAFGDPGKNFPADDAIRLEHEQGLEYFYEIDDPDVKTNILTFEGPGILEPESIEYMRVIEANLKTKPRVIEDTLRTLPFFVETWLTVKNGALGAATYLGAQELPGPIQDLLEELQPATQDAGVQTQFPQTRAEMEHEVQLMGETPIKELAAIIINFPDNDIAAMTFAVRAATYDEAAEVWEQVWDAIEDANRHFGGKAPDGVYVSYVGNTATNYLFVAEELPWLQYMSIASTIILFILVLVFTQNIKATIVATGLAGITSLWWLGLLPFLDIGLAITLMLPLVFIFNIGTDYVVHILWNMRQVGDPREVMSTVGKAILFSAITTAGAFAFFIFIQNVAVSRTMIATTLSIFVIFIATMMVVPIFYPIQAKGEEPYAVRKAQKKAERQAAAQQAAATAVPADAPTYTAVKRRKTG